MSNPTFQVIYLPSRKRTEERSGARPVEPEQCCVMPGRERLVHQRLSIYHGVSTYEQHAITSVMTLHEHSEHAAPNRCIFFHNVAPRHSHTTQPAHRGTGTTDHAHPGMRPTGVANRPRSRHPACCTLSCTGSLIIIATALRICAWISLHGTRNPVRRPSQRAHV